MPVSEWAIIIQNKILLSTSIQIINYLEITRNVLDLQEENNNILQRDILETWLNEKHTLSLEEKTNNVKISIFSKVINPFNASPIKIQKRSLQTFWQENPKIHLEEWISENSQNNSVFYIYLSICLSIHEVKVLKHRLNGSISNSCWWLPLGWEEKDLASGSESMLHFILFPNTHVWSNCVKTLTICERWCYIILCNFLFYFIFPKKNIGGM